MTTGIANLYELLSAYLYAQFHADKASNGTKSKFGKNPSTVLKAINE
jgi:hypothetical protein